VEELSDAELVERCRAGDSEAWNTLVERFSRYVYAICVQGFRLQPHDAEDVFQDVFTKVYEQLGRLRDAAAFRPWLAQLTRRVCIDHLRAAGRGPVELETDPVAPDDVLATLDEALTVRSGLARLSADCREILDRFFARDESYRSISDDLGLPAGTIASRISRCLERLRAAMEDFAAPERQEER
jgi:RNA polymerase sigma-70 factor (ECF subfamily)